MLACRHHRVMLDNPPFRLRQICRRRSGWLIAGVAAYIFGFIGRLLYLMACHLFARWQMTSPSYAIIKERQMSNDDVHTSPCFVGAEGQPSAAVG